jgi:hypothetical protein
MSYSYDENVLTEGAEYSVGLNDGTMFKEIIFEGKKMINGKPILCFRTVKEDAQITINPSYHSWTIEGSMKMNEVVYRQMQEVEVTQ